MVHLGPTARSPGAAFASLTSSGSQHERLNVGPRTFDYADRKRFFGREAEAASLLARVSSERLLLFYAQSGAGKSSLINARLIPRLREEERFSVLPVGRVAGQLPAGVEQVDNIFLFNLMSSLDQGGGSPAQWAHLNLSDFLEHLVTDDGLVWRYDPAAADGPAEEEATPTEVAGPAPRFVLVVDQFEEIVTGHPERWREREVFFRQLDAALQANPNLWMVLSLREDYVAALDPYAPLVFNRLRARFYMERMGKDAGLEAIRKPAELGGRPFGDGVAEQLVNDLRKVRVPGQEATVPGQYVEPVQLQVVCYQLWENLGRGTGGTTGNEGTLITLEDLTQAGDVNQALTQFYEETLAAALADPAAAGVSERQLRAWFDEQLITEAGTRGMAFRGASGTLGMPNSIVDLLQSRFLLRSEMRSGSIWIELIHDRFVAPISESNRRWESQQTKARSRIRKERSGVTALWVDAAERLHNGKVVPIVSAALMFDLVFGPGMHRSFVQGYALEMGYPRADVGLDLVAQFAKENSRDYRWDFLSFAIEGLYAWAEFVTWKSKEVLEDLSRAKKYLSFSESAYRLGIPRFENEPRHPLLQWANLPLPVYVTTSPFTFLETALIRAGKAPRSDFQRGRNGLDHIPPVDDQVSVDHPLVYHLFGIDSYPSSMVLTRDDIGRFFTSSPKLDRSPIMQGIIRSGSYVLAGFRRNDWEFKAVAHTLLKPYSRTRPRGVIQVEADQGDQGPLALLNTFYMELGLRPYHGSATDLLSNLIETITGGL